MLLLTLAVFGGVLTILSHCILPVLRSKIIFLDPGVQAFTVTFG